VIGSAIRPTFRTRWHWVRPDDLDEAAAILDLFIAQTNRGGSNADEQMSQAIDPPISSHVRYPEKGWNRVCVVGASGWRYQWFAFGLNGVDQGTAAMVKSITESGLRISTPTAEVWGLIG